MDVHTKLTCESSLFVFISQSPLQGLDQTQFLEGHSHAEFSFNPN